MWQEPIKPAFVEGFKSPHDFLGVIKYLSGRGDMGGGGGRKTRKAVNEDSGTVPRAQRARGPTSCRHRLSASEAQTVCWSTFAQWE